MSATDVSAKTALALGAISLALIGVGSAAGLSELLPAALAFRIFGLGFVFSLLAIVAGIVAVVRTRPSTGRGGGNLAWGGLAMGMIVFLLVGVAAGAGLGAPAINDITTNVADPPAFRALAEQEANRDREMVKLDPEMADIQKQAYQLAPIQLDLPPAQALERAKQAAQTLGWTIVQVDPSRGTLEATDESDFFHFIDDVVVRVRPTPSGSVVDVRSKSREGRGDLGANAARIEAFRAALMGGGS